MKRFAIILLAILVILPTAALAGAPADALKVRVDKVTTILRDAEYRSAGPEKKKQMLLSVTEDFFSKEEIAKRTLATHWKRFSPEQQEEFIVLFKELLEKNYFARIQDYTYQNEQVVFIGERIEGQRALVQTKVVTQSREIPIDYSLLLENGSWKVYDAVIEGVSLIKNYRTQFHELLSKESPEEFLKRLREKTREPAQPR